jgi:hypothetical protein
MLHPLRFLILAFLTCITVMGASFFRRAIALTLCSVFSFTSLTCNPLLLADDSANAAIANQSIASPIAPLEFPTGTLDTPDPVAICLPLVGCVDTPLPDFIERPLESAIKGEIYRNLAKVLGEEAPIVSSAKNTFPTTKALPGKAFDSDGNAAQLAEKLTLLPDGSVILPEGDYSIPLDVYCMKHAAASPNNHRYLLAPLRGKQANAISALNGRSSNYGISHQQLQVLSWNIQAGMKYEEMTAENQRIINSLIPDYKEQLSQNLVEQLESTYNSIAPKVDGLPPSLDAALDRLGEVGETIKMLKNVQATLQQYGDDYNGLAQILLNPGGFRDEGYQRGGGENTPWSKINDRVYGRLITEGNVGDTAHLQLRVLPAQSSAKQNSQATKGPEESVCSSYCETPAMRLPITSLVADSQSSGIQPLSMAPQLISLVIDFSPLGTAKGLLESLLGRDLITGEELALWERLLAIIPGGRGTSRIVRAVNSINDAEDFLRTGRAGTRLADDVIARERAIADLGREITDVFGSKTDDILRYIKGTPENVGQLASRFDRVSDMARRLQTEDYASLQRALNKHPQALDSLLRRGGDGGADALAALNRFKNFPSRVGTIGRAGRSPDGLDTLVRSLAQEPPHVADSIMQVIQRNYDPRDMRNPVAGTEDFIRYGRILANPADVGSIARNTGLPESVISRVRTHVFDTEHTLPVAPNETTRAFFTPDDKIADLWTKASAGNLNSATELAELRRVLAHEYVESKLMERGMPYRSSDLRAFGGNPGRDYFGAHDVAPAENVEKLPFTMWQHLGEAAPNFNLADDLSNLDQLVDITARIFGK